MAETAQLIRPPLWYRWLTGSVIALIIIVVVIFGATDWRSFGIASVIIALAAFAYPIRSVRAGIALFPEQLVVRGFFASRRIRKSQITSVDRFPFLDWNDEKGISHQTIVAVYSGGSNGGGGGASRKDAQNRLRSWISNS